MTKIMLLVLVLLLESTAFAASRINVLGNSFWEKPGYSEKFSALEQLGVLKSAEQNAFSNCLRRNLQDCRVVESHIVECGGWNGQNTCEGQATANGLL